mmetsp:Transcript_46250/g.74476  ORF Transcript_46250/g.74476 Transcript_46250/m.74476 type:complete len:90 (+) Transcript_46250:296-565(+)
MRGYDEGSSEYSAHEASREYTAHEGFGVLRLLLQNPKLSLFDPPHPLHRPAHQCQLNTRKTESRCAHGKLARVGGGKFKGHEQRDNASC